MEVRAVSAYGAVTSTRTVVAVIAAVLAGCLSLLGVTQARSAEPPPSKLNRLWKEYPLDPRATRPAVQPQHAPAPEAPSAPAPAAGNAWAASKQLLLGAAAIALVLFTSGGLLARSRRRTPDAPIQRETLDELVARARVLAKEIAECDMFLDGQRNGGISVMTESAENDRPVAPGVSRNPGNYADLGERVASVLTAAETAATEIRDDARASATDIVDAARRDAEAVRRDAETYDADTRTAVESYASDRRREVDQEVQKQLADSETQARATRQAAEAMARQIEADGRRRAQALRDESRAVEDRLKKAVVGLRRMTAEIEELLGAPAGDGESLTDALRPYSQRDGEPSSTVAASPAE